MLPDRVSNPGSLTYESGALPIALHGPAQQACSCIVRNVYNKSKDIAEISLDKLLVLSSECDPTPGPDPGE